MEVKKWIFSQVSEANKIESLSHQINVNPVLTNILLQRGIDTFEKAKNFFRPELDQLHDPFLMKDMQIAVERIQLAIEQQESILVYGDYDVDGSTSVAMMYSFLCSIYDKVGYYIPDRYAEGYGVSSQGIDYAAENGYKLIISLDCGIKAIDKVAYAAEKDIDFIICDHHLPGETLPAAKAVLDPKRADCVYPFKELSGCGVGFKLIQAFCISNNLPEHRAFEFLDLVAVSIAADIVAVTGENRILAFYGLEKINFNPRPGIKALLDSADLKGKITISNLVFQLGPRINAAGRIDHAHLAVKLLASINEDEAAIIATQVSEKNNRRKDFDQNITAEAIEKINSDEVLKSAKSTVLYQEGWHKGVIGIVASRCIEQFHRPTIILTESNGKATGSARSVNGFDIHAAIESCAELLSQFGGHTHAAGLTMPIENIAAFTEKFNSVVTSTITEEQLQAKVHIDSYVELEQITPRFYNILTQMDPFGPGNMQPVFAAKNLELCESVRILKEKHLKITVKDKNGAKSLQAIGFGMAHFKEQLETSENFQLAFTIQENEYNGHKSLQLYLKDIRFQ
ncbi:single-stranded-DNA-specific exonuclease RecJ [Marivirga lumbricoides]|uniref:Single-stranded-DNA-specific exonuclease RecJ n=1 Tax=Marivirga lumbricoides TaxID=1046115 RepID=A0ABQ1MP98_9BACT|nr:single-stranded-DNA-specific exonuclease RecJ [Marivirga lumbricoides]